MDPREASAALAEIDDIARRVRQSTLYQLCSLLLILWGVLVAIGDVLTWWTPRRALLIWPVVYALGIAGWIAISRMQRQRSGIGSLDHRILAAFLIFIGFGVLTCAIGQFGPRQLSAFWPIYIMLPYIIVGLWTALAFVVIGLSITALTLVGFFLIGDSFELWLALVNGGGLVLGGLWMRRE